MTTIYVEGGTSGTDHIIAELSNIISANKTSPYIRSGITIKKVAPGTPGINTVACNGTQYRISEWVQMISTQSPQQFQQPPQYQQQQYQPPQQQYQPPQQQYQPPAPQRPPTIQRQQQPQNQQYTRSAANRRPLVNPQQNSGRFDMDSESPPRQQHTSSLSQVSGPQTLKSAFAMQLQGNRGDEEGFSSRDANIIATMMCEQPTLPQGQM